MTEDLSSTDVLTSRNRSNRTGLVLVYTGDGKGKTTAALGLLFRAYGQGFRTCVIQFLKTEAGRWGEVKAAQKLGIEWHKMGDGFTWRSKDLDETTARALHGWSVAQEKIASGAYDLIVLDEFTYPLTFGWLNMGEVVEWLRQNRPPSVHLVITGRDAPAELLELADLVTDCQMVKHPYTRGIKAQAGIEF